MVSALFTVPHVALGQGTWEMRVCADPHNFPASSQRQKGFDNRIAEILADELQAELTYVWAPSGADLVRRVLWPGACDMVMGVADGAMELVSTVPYYQTPYVFVYRQDAEFELDSLEDEVLKTLRISTYPAGAPYTALINQGLRENIVLQQPTIGESGQDRFTPMIEALFRGEVDVAIAYGPDAGYFVQQHAEALKLVPVSPPITDAGLQMLQTLTIGVRPGDEVFRDRLNIALVQRWEEIQAVFGAYGIPLLPLPLPLPPEASRTEPIRIGAVLPIATGNPAITDPIGEAARVGATMAEDLVGRDAERSGRPLHVLLASGPSKDAAVRAAQRLVSTEGVVALVGGLGEGQAGVLSTVAEARDVLFFNIGSPAVGLRQACRRNTFHVEASTAMYLGGLARWFTGEGQRRWFLVHEASEAGRALQRQARRAVVVAGGGAEVVGSAGLTPDSAYGDELEHISKVSPDVVLLLLSPEAQELFLSQYTLEGLTFPITGFPYPIMQTREFLTRLRQVAPGESAGYRAALWETSLKRNGAAALNENFISRSGEPMEPAGWAAYAAVKIIVEAITSAKTQETAALVDFLESPAAVFDVSKGPGTSFRRRDHQLRQPLYMVKIDPEANWGYTVSERIELVELVGELLAPAANLPGTGADVRCPF
jgi:quinoprotein dehydrogenase-associated probable ABC transporter substrate-binding protein